LLLFIKKNDFLMFFGLNNSMKDDKIKEIGDLLAAIQSQVYWREREWQAREAYLLYRIECLEEELKNRPQ